MLSRVIAWIATWFSLLPLADDKSAEALNYPLPTTRSRSHHRAVNKIISTRGMNDRDWPADDLRRNVIPRAILRKIPVIIIRARERPVRARVAINHGNKEVSTSRINCLQGSLMLSSRQRQKRIHLGRIRQKFRKIRRYGDLINLARRTTPISET